MYATIRLESQLNRKMVKSEGLIMANETQILASAVADLLRYSHIPSFPYSVARVSTIPFAGRAGRGAEDVIMQNKANFRMAPQRLTAGQEKGYVKRYELYVCENKANLPGRACSVPVRHRRGRPRACPSLEGNHRVGFPNATYRVWEPTLALLCGPNPPPNPGRTPRACSRRIKLRTNPLFG